MTYQSETLPPPQAAPRAADDSDRTLATINYVLLMVGCFTSGISSLVAVILAYVRREATEPLLRSHFDFQIKTFWLGFCLALFGMILLFAAIPLGFAEAAGWTFDTAAWERLESAGGGRVPIVAIVVGILSILALIASFIWPLINGILGIAKLSANQPIGRAR